MAEFLIRSGCSHQIDQIVLHAREKVWLISPFIKVASHLKELLESKDRDGIDMRLVYGKSELRKGERKWLESLKSLRIYYRENLHAKCYINERFALITSMNLYEFSQINNDEWGILVSRREDSKLYREILREAERIFDRADEESAGDSQPAERTPENERSERRTSRRSQKKAKRSGKRTSRRKPALPKTGVCIRDGESIEFDLSNPYCDKCFRSWNRWKNREYEEEKCHACGQDWATDIDRPLCIDCHRKHGGAIIEQASIGYLKPETGVCIRKGESIEFDLSNPYCGKCFRSWARYENREYQEELCHICGRAGPSTMDSPICVRCYLNVEYISSVQALGDAYVPWASGDDDMHW